MACTVYFCHSLIRLLMTAKRRQVRRRRVHYDQPTRDLDMAESFTHIDRPIPVIFATDLEMGLRAGAEENENKPGQVSIPPPAYGLWRGSVVSLDLDSYILQTRNDNMVIRRWTQAGFTGNVSTRRNPIVATLRAWASPDRQAQAGLLAISRTKGASRPLLSISNPNCRVLPQAQLRRQPSNKQNATTAQLPVNIPS